MDVPIALGIGVAFAASVYATFTGGGAGLLRLDHDVRVLPAVRALPRDARAAEGRREPGVPGQGAAARRASSARLSREPWTPRRCAAVTLRAGRPGAGAARRSFPADGVVVDGETETRRGAAHRREPAGAQARRRWMVSRRRVNRLSPAVMRVERVGEDTRASHIRRLTERAAAQRPHVVEMADRIAGLVRRRRCCWWRPSAALFWTATRCGARAVGRGRGAGRDLPVRACRSRRRPP